MQSVVKSFMTGNPAAIDVGSSALAALELMIDRGIRHLPVVESGQLVVGVVSFDDLRAAFPIPVSLAVPPTSEERPVLRDIAVGEVMTHAPRTVRCGEPLEQAAEVMVDRRIGCLPVVDEQGHLDGMLTETDLLQALVTVLWTDRHGAPLPEEPAPSGIEHELRRERERIQAQLDLRQREEQELTVARRELPLDLAEHGADVRDASLSEGLAGHAARRLRAIDHALERADSGQLTECERCRGSIPEARLRALPGTTLCVRCAREAEHGAR